MTGNLWKAKGWTRNLAIPIWFHIWLASPAFFLGKNSLFLSINVFWVRNQEQDSWVKTLLSEKWICCMCYRSLLSSPNLRNYVMLLSSIVCYPPVGPVWNQVSSRRRHPPFPGSGNISQVPSVRSIQQNNNTPWRVNVEKQQCTGTIQGVGPHIVSICVCDDKNSSVKWQETPEFHGRNRKNRRSVWSWFCGRNYIVHKMMKTSVHTCTYRGHSGQCNSA